jgi:hypothetical protein
MAELGGSAASLRSHDVAAVRVETALDTERQTGGAARAARSRRRESQRFVVFVGPRAGICRTVYQKELSKLWARLGAAAARRTTQRRRSESQRFPVFATAILGILCQPAGIRSRQCAVEKRRRRKRWKTTFLRRLEIRQKRRDFHLATAQATRFVRLSKDSSRETSYDPVGGPRKKMALANKLLAKRACLVSGKGPRGRDGLVEKGAAKQITG